MKKIEWKRVQVSCVTALMLFMLFAAIKPQLYITEEYTGASVRGYQAAPLAGYLVLSVLICALLIWKGAVNNRRLANAGAVLSLLIMPFISFFIFETVAGNFVTILQNQTSLVFLNLCIWYLLYAVVFAASNCIRFTILTLNTISYFFAVANAFVVQFREQPIMVMDIKSFLTAVSVAGEFQYDLTVNMVLMGLLALFCNLWILKMDFRFPRFKFRLGYIFLTAGCVGYCLYGMYFGNLFEKAGLTGLDFFRFNLSYKKAGYMACTSLSLKYLQVEEPEGYSAERVKEIQERTASSDPIQRDLPENIIVIMNESLSDLSVLGDFETSEEMLPYLNSMQENTVRGWAYTSVYGGGTANSEFEFLIGNSVAFIPAGTVAYQMYVEEGDASLTGLLKENGYRTIVYHPYRKDNYNRPAVYQIYGFDEYYAKGDIKHNCDFSVTENRMLLIYQIKYGKILNKAGEFV